MFSFYLGKLKGVDIRKVGDGNPGAVNAFKASGHLIGILAMLLDFNKGFIPLFILYQRLGIKDFRIVPIAIALVLGHAFSVFLRFQGGKAIAVTFGIWAGLTLYQVPVILGLALLFFKFGLRIKNDAYNIVLGMLVSFIFIILKFNLVLIAVFIFNLLIIIYKHRNELTMGLK